MVESWFPEGTEVEKGIHQRLPAVYTPHRRHNKKSRFPQGTMKEFPPFRLDPVNQCLWRRRDDADEQPIVLTSKAFAMLRYLVEHAVAAGDAG